MNDIDWSQMPDDKKSEYAERLKELEEMSREQEELSQEDFFPED